MQTSHTVSRLARQMAEAIGVPLDVLVAIGFVIGAWLLALLLRQLTVVGLTRLVGAGPLTTAGRPSLATADLDRTRRTVGRIVFWLTITLGLMVATERLGLPVLTTWFSGVASYLPRLVVAVLIFVAGVGIARLAAGAAHGVAERVGAGDAGQLARIAELSVLAVTAIVAIEALGIDITFIEVALLLVLGAILLSGALAFGGGARPLVTDILACHYVQRVYGIGQILRLADGDETVLEGRIVRIAAPLVILETGEGEVSVPGSRITSGRTLRVADWA